MWSLWSSFAINNFDVFRSADGTVTKYCHEDGSETAIKKVLSEHSVLNAFYAGAKFAHSKNVELIAERKLNISFSDYIVRIIDSTTKISYVEYFKIPQQNAHLAFVHATVKDALDVALKNCRENLTVQCDIVMTKTGESL